MKPRRVGVSILRNSSDRMQDTATALTTPTMSRHSVALDHAPLLYRLQEAIPAIPIASNEDGDRTLGVLARLPRGTRLEVHAKGFNESTFEARANELGTTCLRVTSTDSRSEDHAAREQAFAADRSISSWSTLSAVSSPTTFPS